MNGGQPLEQPRSFGKTAKRSAIWDFGGRFSSQGVLFIASVFLARLLTPADFGITAASRFFVTLATRLTQLGLNASLVRMKEIRPEHASSVFVVNLAMGVLAFLCLFYSSPALGRLFDSPDVTRVLPVTATAFLITPFGSVAAAMLNRHLRYRETTMIQWLDGVSGTLIALLLAWLQFGYWSLVLGALAGTVLSTAAKVYASPWTPSLRFSSRALKDTLSFGLGFQAKRLLQFSANNLDNLVVGKMLGVVALGYYDKGFGLMRQMTDRMTFDSALMRIFAIISDQPERFRKALVKGILATSIITFPILCFSAVAADRIIIVLFGPQWVPSVGPFQVLALIGVVRSGMRAVHAANDSLGLVWLQAAQQLLFVVLTVAGVAVGSSWGLTAATLGLLPGVILYSILSVRLLTRHSAVTVADILRAFWPGLATAAAVSLTVLGVDAALHALTNPPPWAALLAMLVTAGLSYPAFILWTPFGAVRTVVRESVDDLVPGMPKWVNIGALRKAPGEAAAPVAGAAAGASPGNVTTG